MSWSVLLVLSGSTLLALGASQPTPGCDYYQEVIPGNQYHAYSPNYPRNYPAGVTCRWEAIAPTGSLITLNCNVSMPPSQNCQEDRLSVSSSGNADLTDAHQYCGQGSFQATSESNRILMVLSVPYFSQGGNFYCSLSATTEGTTKPPETCDCGWKKETRIVNGQETGVNEYPMMAALVDYQLRTLFCGATIISRRYCLTAGHCLLNRQTQYTGVLVGDHDISVGTDTDSARVINIENFTAHPLYNSVTQENDVAVVRVAEDIPFSLEVGPVCIPFRFANSNYLGLVVNLLGWGTTEQAGPTSDVLLETRVDVINIDQCVAAFGDKVSNKQICTFRNGTDACQADSGGPVLWQGPGDRMQLLGVISYGRGCATRYPGVNTRVASYINWILDVTPDAEYCVR